MHPCVAERAHSNNADFDFAYWMMIAANAQLGRMDEARNWLAKFQALVPGITIARIKAGTRTGRAWRRSSKA